MLRTWVRKIQWNKPPREKVFSTNLCKDFEIKNLCEYQDLYVQSDGVLIADVINKFGNMCP